MTRRQLARKPRQSAARNLSLVPEAPPTPQPRRRRSFGRIGRVFKAKYVPELLAYEQDMVYRVIVEMGGRVTVDDIMRTHPGRFDRLRLWWVLLRLANDGRVGNTGRLALGHKRLFRDGFEPKAWWERSRRPRRHTEFFTL